MTVATAHYDSRREPATVLETPKRRGRRSKVELRAEYRTIRNKLLMWFDKDTVDAAVRSKAAQLCANRGKRAVSPEMWVEAIKLVRLPCDHCSGDGVYRWGACVNGKMTHSGPCFRCQGKGKMDADDCVRTRTYHNHLRVV